MNKYFLHHAFIRFFLVVGLRYTEVMCRDLLLEAREKEYDKLHQYETVWFTLF